MAKRVKLGDVFAIPLPNGKYAFCRKYRDAAIGVYKHIGESKKDYPVEEDYSFFVGVYDDVLTSGKWEVVDRRNFSSEDEGWPPPMCSIDQLSGKFSIYHKGMFSPATEQECEGLEVAAIWEGENIVDRIMGKQRPVDM